MIHNIRDMRIMWVVAGGSQGKLHGRPSSRAWRLSSFESDAYFRITSLIARNSSFESAGIALRNSKIASAALRRRSAKSSAEAQPMGLRRGIVQEQLDVSKAESLRKIRIVRSDERSVAFESYRMIQGVEVMVL